MATRNVMAVRTDVVQRTMVARLVELVRAEQAHAPAALAAVPEWDADLAAAGYKLRRVERRLFEPARRYVPEFAKRLADSAKGLEPGSERVARIARDLASAEPLARPDPDDEGATTWRVPGPGGHVRHYVALELVGARPAEQKRAVVYGFLFHSCEEALEAQRAS